MAANPDSVVRTWFEEVWNRGLEDTIDRLFAVDGIAHGLPGNDLKGPADFKPFFRNFRGAFPDMRIEVTRSVTEGDMIAVHCRVTGTHTGHTMGKATGNPMEFLGMCIARVRNGQIVEAWNSFDFLTLYQQLGLLPKLPV
jgi:predicted ester cyclase